MDLYFYSGRIDLAATSLTDLRALIAALDDELDPANAQTVARIQAKLPPFILADTAEPLNLYFYDDAETAASWVADTSIILGIGLGYRDVLAADSFTSTTTIVVSGGARVASLALNTTALQNALLAPQSDPRGRREPFVLHLRKSESGNTETVGLLPVQVRPGVLSATVETPTPTTSYVDIDTFRAGCVLNKAGLASLTGGGATALDGLGTASGASPRYPVGCVVLTALNDLPQHWRLKSGTTAEDGLTVIRPDDYHASTNPVYWQLLA